MEVDVDGDGKPAPKEAHELLAEPGGGPGNDDGDDDDDYDPIPDFADCYKLMKPLEKGFVDVRTATGRPLGQLQPLPRIGYAMAARCDVHPRCSRQREWKCEADEPMERVERALVRWQCADDVDELARARGVTPTVYHMKHLGRQ